MSILASYLFPVYIVFRIGTQILSQIGYHYLVQDKYCINIYNQSDYFCQNIHKLKDNETYKDIADKIFADSTKFNLFYALADLFPIFFWTLFVGSFLDKNKNATKMILYFHVLGDIVHATIFLLNEIFYNLHPFFVITGALTSFLAGGSATFFIVSYRFVAVTTKKDLRPVRLMLVQFGLVLGASFGSLVAGILLRPVDLTGSYWHIRTYYLNFIASIAVNILCIPLLVAVFKIGDAQQLEVELENAQDEAKNEFGNQDYDAKLKNIETNTDNNNQQESQHFWSKRFFYELFDIDNIKSTFTCLVRPRPDRINISILCIYISYFFLYFAFIGTDSVSLQFCEKVYGWSASQYSNVNAVYRIVMTLTVGVIVYVFARRMHIDDSILTTFSALVSAVSHLIVGIFLRDLVYFAGMPFLGVCGVAFVALRNKLTLLVKSDEVGKFYSIVEMIMSTLPFISSAVYSKLFSIVISFFPGIVYQFSGAVYFAVFVVIMFEQIYCRRGFFQMKSDIADDESSTGA